MPGLQIVAAAAAHPAAASRERQGSPSERDSSYEGGGIGLAGRYLLTSLRTTNSHSHSNALSCPGIAPLNATSPTTSTTTLSSSPSSNNNNNIISTVDAPWHSLEIASSSSSSTSCTGGESPRSTRDPDLRRSSSVPPPLSLPSSPVSIATSASSELFHEGLTRLDSFVDLARLHQEYASAFDSNSLETGNFCDHENALFPEDWQTIPKGQDEHLGYLPTGTNAGLTVSEAPTATAAHSHSTFYSEPSPTTFYTKDSDSPSYATSFFDPTPSSAGASPRTPYDFTYSRQPSDLMAPRRLVTPEPTEPATYWTSAAGPPQQQQPYQPTMKSSQWRPRSAPKVTDSRSASPLVFWNRRGAASGLSHRQPQDDREEFDATWPRVGTARGYDDSTRDDGDNMLVDTVSNHLGRLTPPSPSNSVGNRSMDSRRKDRDLRISTQEAPKSNRDNDFCQGPPPMITKAEYSALPLAIQRKYFSTLERLRFAQESDEVDRIFDHYESQNTATHHQPHRKHRPALSSPETLSAVPNPRKFRASLATAISDDSWVVNYPEKISKADLTREEQVRLIRHLRASVILDAAGEAITQLQRPNERNLSPTPDIEHSSATLSTRRGSLDSMASAMLGAEATSGRDATRQSLYDSFRWLDEEENLDLSLFLDDYHANLRDEVPQTSKNRRPSFRRRLSISKLPFGRPSVSSTTRPETKDAKDASPLHSPTFAPHPSGTQGRLSRTFSVIHSNKHAHSESVSVIDPTATHYQDPEARQKLRAYLASEQKFDEALQFGFPATDPLQGPATLDQRPRKRQSRSRLNDDDEPMRSFLDFDGDEDDDHSDKDDRSSVSDPDSPLTPQIGGGLTPPPGHFRPSRVNTDPLGQRSSTSYQRQTSAPSKPMSRDSYAQFNGTSREMTLRMTLTRPDLRADDELIYGWQPQAGRTSTGRRSTGPLPKDTVLKDLTPTEEPLVLKGQTTTACWSESQANKASIEKMLAEMDQDGTDNALGDRGVMKRLWNKVRRA